MNNEHWLVAANEWLRKRVAAAEERDPELRYLKLRVSEAQAAHLAVPTDEALRDAVEESVAILLRHIRP